MIILFVNSLEATFYSPAIHTDIKTSLYLILSVMKPKLLYSFLYKGTHFNKIL